MKIGSNGEPYFVTQIVSLINMCRISNGSRVSSMENLSHRIPITNLNKYSCSKRN